METFAEDSRTGFAAPQPYDHASQPSALKMDFILPQSRALDTLLDAYPGALLILAAAAYLGWRKRVWWTPLAIYGIGASCAFLVLGRSELGNLLHSSHGELAFWILPWLCIAFFAGRFARGFCRKTSEAEK